MSIFQACTDISEDFTQTRNPDIEYKELTSEEVALKNQLAETAKIVAEIAGDEEVLNEIVATIKSQPRIMEDRVKFADLMSTEQKLKSENTDIVTGKFAAAFVRKLNFSGLKSAGTLIENLTSQGVEVYIPYPIEDYPKGTEIVVTSTPLDNVSENIGYFAGDTEKTIIANQELTESLPLIIITPSVISSEEIASYSEESSNKIGLKSVNIDPLSVWDNENYKFRIYLDYVYIKEDYVNTIFEPEGNIHYLTGTVSFNSANSSITNNSTANEVHYSRRFPRKYERWAQLGWGIGMFPIDQLFIPDWHPGMTSTTWAFFMDLPTKTIVNSTTLTAEMLQKITVPLPPINLEIDPKGSISNTVSKSITFGDYLYGSFPFSRSDYKDFYNESDVWSQAHGDGWVQISDGGWRPVREVTGEFYFVTHCEVTSR